MDGLIVFARWRQCAFPRAHIGVNVPSHVHIGATWRIRLNLCFLRPTRVHNPNDKSISSAISAQLMAESPYTLQWVTLSPKIAPFHGDLDPMLFMIFWASLSPQSKWHHDFVQLFLHRWLQSVPILYYGCPFWPKLSLTMCDLDPI